MSDSIDAMVAKLREFPGWPVYKIKLGTAEDLEIVRSLRQHTDAVFRVDANCAWGAEETIRKSAALKALGVEFIEQPLAPQEWSGMRRVYRESALPVVADESCQAEADVDRCTGYFQGLGIGSAPRQPPVRRRLRLSLSSLVLRH
jgi:L-alanine-DL-glutamate epimerase-like enolase superfamily enzyme